MTDGQNSPTRVTLDPPGTCASHCGIPHCHECGTLRILLPRVPLSWVKSWGRKANGSRYPEGLMALERPYDDADGPGEARPELHLHHGRTGGDAHPPQREPPETRSRAECYDALRAADGRPGASDNGDRPAADSRPGHSGWDGFDAENRPALDAARVSPERRTHILDGDDTGGGHRHGTGEPGKTEFPAAWRDEKIIANALDVARKPDAPPIRQDRNDSWLCAGTRENVEVSVVIMRSGEIWTSWPEEGGPGVVRNPRKGKS
jgi:EndoU nuclease-like protein